MPMTPSAVPTEAETDEKKAKIKTFEDEPTEPTLNQGGPSSGSGRNDEPILISEKPAIVEPSQEAMETEQVIDKSPMEIKVSARRAWPGGDDENPEKRARVGGVYVGALYSPTEDVIVYEEDVEMAAVDSDDEESKPLTEEERAQGREVEYGKMDKYDAYEPVSYQPGMKVLDATWVEVRKPDGAVRCRYCVREFKRGDPRTDVFAVASRAPRTMASGWSAGGTLRPWLSIRTPTGRTARRRESHVPAPCSVLVAACSTATPAAYRCCACPQVKLSSMEELQHVPRDCS